MGIATSIQLRIGLGGGLGAWGCGAPGLPAEVRGRLLLLTCEFPAMTWKQFSCISGD